MTPVTLITGASAGIGRELARVFARHGHDLVLVARREQRLNELAAEIEASGRPKPLVLAIDSGASRTRPSGSARRWRPAGLSRRPSSTMPVSGWSAAPPSFLATEQLGMIDLNVRALTDLSLSFIDSLARHRGGLLNVASVAGFPAGAGLGGVLRRQGLRAVVQRGAASRARAAGDSRHLPVPRSGGDRISGSRRNCGGKPPWPLAVSAERVAEAGYRGLMRGQRVVVPGLANKLLAALVPRFVPRNVLLAQLDRRQLKRASQP